MQRVQRGAASGSALKSLSSVQFRGQLDGIAPVGSSSRKSATNQVKAKLKKVREGRQKKNEEQLQQLQVKFIFEFPHTKHFYRNFN